LDSGFAGKGEPLPAALPDRREPRDLLSQQRRKADSAINDVAKKAAKSHEAACATMREQHQKPAQIFALSRRLMG